MVPPRPRSYRGTPTPRAPASLCSSLCFAVPAVAGSHEGSQVPGRPLCTCAGLRPRWRRAGQDPGAVPLRFDLLAVAFRVVHRVGLHNIAAFGARYRRPRTRCLRFAAALAGGPRKTRFRLAVLGLGRSGLAPAGRVERFQSLHVILLSQACPGARTEPLRGRRGGAVVVHALVRAAGPANVRRRSFGPRHKAHARSRGGGRGPGKRLKSA